MNEIPPVAELAAQLVRIPSVNPMGRRLDAAISYEHRVTDFLENLFQKWGLRYERQVADPPTTDAPPRENILAVLPGQARMEFAQDLDRPTTVMLEVHQDTVPVDGMTIEPWSGEIRDGCVHGRGSCDIKGGMAALLTTLTRLKEVPETNRPNIVLACSVNEEHGFSGATALAKLWKSGTSELFPTAPDAIVVTEPTMLDVVVAHKGCIRWKCHTQGIATHSSQPQKGKNAIYTMAKVVSAFEKYATEVAPSLGEHPRLSHPTLSVGTIRGGVSVNTVPDQCVIQIDHRVLPGQDARDIRENTIAYVMKQLGEELNLDDQSISFTDPTILANGMPDDCNDDFASALTKSIQSLGHRGDHIGVAYGTDAAALAIDNIPTVVFGPGDIAQAHTKDEWVSIEQLEQAVEILVKFLRVDS